MNMQIKSVKTSSEFAKEIEKIVKDKKLEYLEAVLLYCTSHDLEIESIASLVKTNQTLKAKIQTEAEDLNFLPRSARLPL